MRTLARVLLVLALGVLAGCGADDEPDATRASPSASESSIDAAALQGTTYVSTSVQGHELVEGSTIRIAFEDDTMSVSAGCNTLFAPFALSGETLAWSDAPAATMMACPADLAAQDEWLADLLTTGVAAAADGTSLTLDSADVTVELERAPQADLEQLLGATWSVVGTIADGSTSRLPARTRTPRLVVGQDGLSRLDTGCNTGRTRVQVDSVSISFAPPTVTKVACPEPDSVIEQIVLAVVDGRSDYVQFDGSVLILVKGGQGLVFQVRG